LERTFLVIALRGTSLVRDAEAHCEQIKAFLSSYIAATNVSNEDPMIIEARTGALLATNDSAVIGAIHRKHAGRHFSEDSNFRFY